MGWIARIRNLGRRGKVDAEIEEELRAHVEMAVEDGVRAGLNEEEARRAARVRFGNPVVMRERTVGADAALGFESLWRDVKFALRQMKKSPGFAVTAVLTLALGIGANTAIFSTMNAVLLRTLPVRSPQQLFYLTHENTPNGVGNTGNQPWDYGINVYDTLRANRSVFSDLIAYVPLAIDKTAVRFGNAPEEVEADEVSGNFFSGLGVRMAVGRGFTDGDEQNHTQTAVLSYAYWTRRFDRNPDVIGETLYVNGVPMTIVGVAGPHFYGVEPGGLSTSVWVPLQTRPELNAWGMPATDNTLYGSPNWWVMMLIARLRSGVTEARALAAMDPLFKRAALETIGRDVKGQQPPLNLEMVAARGLGLGDKSYQEPLRVLMGMVALVLLIACVNLLMLMAARNAAREREFAVRLALGVRRWTLFRQLLAESALLVGAGALLGWFFAVEATRLLGNWALLQVGLEPDGTVLLFTLVVAAAAAVAFGLAPLRAAASAPVTVALKSGGTQTMGNRSRALTGKALIAGQMALCVALLFGAALLVRTLQNYRDINLGFQADQVLAFEAPPVGVTENAGKLAFYRDLTEQVSRLPGVESVTLAGNRPGSEWSDNNALVLDGREIPWDNGNNMLRSNEVGPGFFRTLGIPILEGRGITAADTKGAARVAVVNETLARRYLKGESPIGHTLGDPKHPILIVGMVKDSKYTSADEEAIPMAWYCYEQGPSIENMDVEVRVAGDPLALLPEVRRIVRGIDPNTPVNDPMVLSAEFAEGYAMPALTARLAGFFGGLAALLVAVGLYGTLSYRVNRRGMEVGLRMALGAQRGQVLWMILRESLVLVAVGLAVGLPLAWFGSKWLGSMLYKLHAHDPVSFVCSAVGVLAISLLAAYLPARRAASVDPMQALRSE
ncbi:MAG: ABC transporter permease [Acidobacteriaceae bacterium]